MRRIVAGPVSGLACACLVVAGAGLPASADPDHEVGRATASAPEGTTPAAVPDDLGLTADSPEFLAAMEVAQQQQEIKAALDQYGILTGFPDLRAGGGWVEGEDLLVVQYDRRAKPARLAEFLAATEAAAGLDLPVDVEYRPVDFNEAELSELAEEISIDADGSWSDRLGVDSIIWTHGDTETGAVVVGGEGAEDIAGASTMRSSTGVRIIVREAAPEDVVLLQGPTADPAP